MRYALTLPLRAGSTTRAVVVAVNRALNAYAELGHDRSTPYGVRALARDLMNEGRILAVSAAATSGERVDVYPSTAVRHDHADVEQAFELTPVEVRALAAAAGAGS